MTGSLDIDIGGGGGAGGGGSGVTVTNVTLLNGANTLADPGGAPADGDRRLYRLRQPGSGAAGTITLGAAFRLPAGITLGPSTTNNHTDLLAAVYHAAAGRWDVVSFIPGYAAP